MEKFANPGHPIWVLARTALILGTVSLFLHLNATNFDETELRAIFEIALGLLVIEFIQNRAQRQIQKKVQLKQEKQK